MPDPNDTGDSTLYNLLNGGGAPTAGGASGSTLSVYMGQRPGVNGAGKQKPHGQKTTVANSSDAIYKPTVGGDNILDQSSAENSYYSWAPVEQQQFAAKLYRAGIISDPSDFNSAVAFWKQAVEYAGNQYTNGNKKVTPWDVVQQSLGLSKAAGAGNGPKTTTATNTSTATQVLTNGDADAMVQAMYQNELGRNATDGELSRYRSMLINKSKNDPATTKTTTTTHTDGKGNSTSSNNSVQTGGESATGMNNDLQTQVQADPDWGAYQAATTYMQAIEGLFSSPNLTSG